VGERLGKYRLVAELARGGMAIAWLAETRGPGGFVKHFVVKKLLPNLARDEEHRAMFLDEARLAARLGHANIVETIDLGRDGDRLFMVLELVTAGTVLPRLVDAGEPDVRAAITTDESCATD